MLLLVTAVLLATLQVKTLYQVVCSYLSLVGPVLWPERGRERREGEKPAEEGGGETSRGGMGRNQQRREGKEETEGDTRRREREVDEWQNLILKSMYIYLYQEHTPPHREVLRPAMPNLAHNPSSH